MKRVLTLAIVFVAGIAAAGIAIVWHGVGARNEPGAIETRVARTLRRLSIGMRDRARRNPLPASPEALAEARAHFADHCATCHANDGSGSTDLGRSLYPRAPDMRLPTTQRLSDGELFTIIRDGVRLTGMPGFGGEDADNWKLVHFIRHLPKLTPDEIREMERLNPKSPSEIEEMREEEEFLKGER